jgi:hypothetical protein
MKRIIHYVTAATALGAALTMAPAYSALQPQGAADEVVKITPDTKSLGVYRNDTVRFVDQQSGRSFVERFGGNTSHINLNRLAPAGALGDQHVTVYVWDRTGEANG